MNVRSKSADARDELRAEDMEKKQGNRKCETCRFSAKFFPNPKIAQSQLMCKWGPPTAMLVPGPQGQMGQSSAWPIVAGFTWCFRWESDPEPITLAS
jgi:hypothetical protein